MYLKLLLVILLNKVAFGAKILAIMVVPSHSHHLWNTKYLEALADRGHEITYLSVDKYNNPTKSIKNIHLNGVYEGLDEVLDLTGMSEWGPYYSEYLLSWWEDIEVGFQFKSENLKVFKDTIRREKFDLIVFDAAACPYLLGAADVLGNPPIVAVTAFGVPTHVLQMLGNPMTYSSRPHFLTPYSNQMTVFQRADNYFLHLFSFAVRWFFMRKQSEYSKKCFGDNIRPLEQILDDINIALVNWNQGVDYAFPRVPGLIPVAGMHIDEPRPLPKELQSFLDDSKDGVVYFSLGSNIQSAYLGQEVVKILNQAFEQLSPVRVLWKWEADTLPGKPKNVKTSKWLPQNDVLAHPNVRAFFTHAGLLSSQEALYNGKPIIAMPFFLDQQVNAMKLVQKGLGEHVQFATISVGEVVKCIRKVLDDPRYLESARNASVLFRDVQVNARDRAVYWTEYAIRHRGARHLRHSTRDLAWYQVLMLDIVVGLLVVALTFYFVLKACLGAVCGGSKDKLKRS